MCRTDLQGAGLVNVLILDVPLLEGQGLLFRQCGGYKALKLGEGKSFRFQSLELLGGLHEG